MVEGLGSTITDLRSTVQCLGLLTRVLALVSMHKVELLAVSTSPPPPGGEGVLGLELRVQVLRFDSLFV